MIGFFIIRKMKQKTETFEGTKTAFMNLISKRKWYQGLIVNGVEIDRISASQIKIRTKNGKKISQDYMEKILLSAGYKIARQILWTK